MFLSKICTITRPQIEKNYNVICDFLCYCNSWRTKKRDKAELVEFLLPYKHDNTHNERIVNCS